jgi:hypothetical protein
LGSTDAARRLFEKVPSSEFSGFPSWSNSGTATDTGDPETTNRPERSLGRFTYDPSQGSPFVKPPLASQPSADGSLSINDAYLEYLKRLNAN